MKSLITYLKPYLKVPFAVLSTMAAKPRLGGVIIGNWINSAFFMAIICYEIHIARAGAVEVAFSIAVISLSWTVSTCLVASDDFTDKGE